MTARGRRSAGTPLVFDQDTHPVVLERVWLGQGQHDEKWLQQRLDQTPSLLPVTEVEPAFGELVSVAQEVPCGHGYIDNLFVTASGEVALAEAKLWRNPQARREVVAQALDYVSALTTMSYEEFEAAIRRGKPNALADGSLYDFVSQHADALDEAAFIDAVTRNLRRGRILVMVVGDGIRSEAETLGNLLQGHAGAHFSLALIELAVWRNPVSSKLTIVPNTLAQTIMIERGVVRLVDGTLMVEPPVAVQSIGTGERKSLSDELFYERLGTKHPTFPALLQGFVRRLAPFGVYPDVKAALSLRVDLPEHEVTLNLGYVQVNGQLWVSPPAAHAVNPAIASYLETLVILIDGQRTGPNGYLTTNGTSAPRLDVLLPQHGEAWADAVKVLIESFGATHPRKRTGASGLGNATEMFTLQVGSWCAYTMTPGYGDEPYRSPIRVDAIETINLNQFRVRFFNVGYAAGVQTFENRYLELKRSSEELVAAIVDQEGRMATFTPLTEDWFRCTFPDVRPPFVNGEVDEEKMLSLAATAY